MKLPVKRRLIAPAILLAALAGGAVAVAATSSSSSSPRQAYLDSVARHLGVTPAKLTSALQAAALERIEAAVASGRVGKQEGQALEQRVKEGRGPLFGGGLGDHRPGTGPRHALIAAAASYLGVTPQTLHSQRREGKSLAQIAAATPGKSATGLKAALAAAAGKELDAAVASGRLTAAKAQLRKARLPRLLEALVQRTGTGPHQHPPGGHGHRSGTSLAPGAPTGASV
jgi:hypothetical protein